MNRAFAAVAVAALSMTTAFAQNGNRVSPDRTAVSATVNQYCLGCHNEKLKSGNFSWSSVDLAHPEQNAEQVEKAVNMLRVGMMPPPGMPRLTAAARNALVSYLENSVDQAAAANPNAGKQPLHRLNRTEYANSIRELLAVDIDVSALLPPDDSSHGFDNMADVLMVSPTLMEGYIRAAGRISREAVGDVTAPALTTTYQIPRVVAQTRHFDGTPWGTRGGISVIHDFPADGEYVFKMGFYYSPTGPLFGLNQGKGQQIEVAVNGVRVALIDINPAMKLASDGIKTPPIAIKAGPQRISASFPQKFDGPLEDEYRMVEQSLVDVSAGVVPGMTTLPHLHELSITGPTKVSGVSDTPSRSRIFTCRPAAGSDEIPCAKAIISNLARVAFRRPVSGTDLEDLLSFYQSGRNQGDFESGIRTAIQAMIASPEFVFRLERASVSTSSARAAAGSNYRITDLELASRLSYFLWSTAPDEQLISVASQGKLKDPAVLEKQVRRMLADPRAEVLATNFAYQWLHLQNLKDANPDLFLHPDFDKTLSQAMMRETELLFDSLRTEDRNILDLVTANYTFVNERLAKHYGIPNILGNRFRRVTLTDPNRFGILGQGSVLMLTSTATRTSPVQRGKYVMEVLLGTPPPPPPADVPALKESTDDPKVQKSVREQMQAHRANPVCAGCHALMDPIGFSLENYDAVGVWRTNDGAFRVDPSGKMFDGTALNGPASLRQAIVNHSDVYVGAFTRNLLAYGLGRVIDYRDLPVVRQIQRQAAKNDNRFSTFILGVVNSVPFQFRRVEESEPVSSTTAGGR